MIARRAFAYWRRRSWKRAAMQIETEAGWHRRKKRQAVRRSLAQRFGETIAPVTIITGDQTGVNAVGDRAWPEVSGEPPVFGNRIGEIGHTAGGSWIWTGFTWERAILGG